MTLGSGVRVGIIIITIIVIRTFISIIAISSCATM